jgi:Xaa-Pro aminopeptidase
MKPIRFSKIIIYGLTCLFFLHTGLAAQSPDMTGFARRRRILMDKLADGIVILKAASVSPRNSDNNYPFRQSSNFYYLTGFEEPQAIAVLRPGESPAYILFVTPSSPRLAAVIGETSGVQGAITRFGADTAFALTEFWNLLPQYTENEDKVFFNSSDLNFRTRISEALKEQGLPMSRRRLRSVSQLSAMRLIKDAEEIRCLRKAIDITCDAQIEAMRASEPGMVEYEIRAVIEYIFRKNGSPRNGFQSIVGSGPNSTIAHYSACTRQTEPGDMICMDIGAEYGYYSADVTRTIPVSGRFSPAQRDLYEIILRAEKEAVAMSGPGKRLGDIYNNAVEVVTQGLHRLGLITDPEKRWQVRVWNPYGIGHWLGLDTHDVGPSTAGTILQPGMVYTVEPGAYISHKVLDNLKAVAGGRIPEEELDDFIRKVRPVVEKYNNIGIRVEDDILITEDGYENLSAKAPREIAEIEALMAEKSYLNR